MFQKCSYAICNLSGDNKFSTIENLIGTIDKIVNSWWTILSNLNFDGEIIEIYDWWNLPHKSNDFDKEAFSTIFNHYQDDINNIKTVYLRSKEKNRYCACLKLNDKIIFKSLPNNDKYIAFNNLKMNILGVGSNLEKIQSGAWNALIDTDNPEYVIKRNGFYDKVIEKVGK
jgi:hypothetical protein